MVNTERNIRARWGLGTRLVISTLPHSLKKLYRIRSPLSMEVKSFWRWPQIYACNPLHGANINITIRLNFLWHAHQVVLFHPMDVDSLWFVDYKITPWSISYNHAFGPALVQSMGEFIFYLLSCIAVCATEGWIKACFLRSDILVFEGALNLQKAKWLVGTRWSYTAPSGEALEKAETCWWSIQQERQPVHLYHR